MSLIELRFKFITETQRINECLIKRKTFNHVKTSNEIQRGLFASNVSNFLASWPPVFDKESCSYIKNSSLFIYQALELFT